MRLIIIFIILYTLSITTVNSQNHANDLPSNFDISAEQWQQDISFLKEHAPMFHKDLFNKMSRKDFDDYVTNLNRDIPSLTTNQVYARLMKLVAMFGDGHTTLQATTADFYPVRFHVFTDGVFVIDADNKDLIGKKLLSIEGITAEQIYEKLSPYVSHDNEWQIKGMIPLYMSNARLLNGIGIAKSDKEITLKLSDRTGNTYSENITPIPHAEFRKYMPYAHTELKEPPLYLQNSDKHYWFKYLDDSKTLYFRYNVVLTDKSESIPDFIHRMSEVVDKNEIEKFIIDVRGNGGGDNFTSLGFIDYISNNPKINQEGKLFLLIDRKTFSAASFFTSGIENRTNAIIVGEPTGATPNHYGDAVNLTLPNSALAVRLSTILWENSFPWDSRMSTNPEIMVEITSDDYFMGKDPVLEAVMNYTYKQPKPYELTVDELNKVYGRYRYTDEEALEIYDNNGLLEMKISDGLGISFTDFIKTSLYPISKKKFLTSIQGVEIEPDLTNGRYVILKTNGNEARLEKDDAYLLPSELLNSGKYSDAIEIYKKIKNEGSNRKLLNELVINQIGYSLLRKKKYEAAIALLKLNTEFYPNSSNVYDSLGEAFMLSGDNEMAVINYKKSLELDPDNDNASQIIKRLSSK